MSNSNRIDPRDVYDISNNNPGSHVNSAAIGWAKWAKSNRISLGLMMVAGIITTIFAGNGGNQTFLVLGASFVIVGGIGSSIMFLIQALAEMNNK